MATKKKQDKKKKNDKGTSAGSAQTMKEAGRRRTEAEKHAGDEANRFYTPGSLGRLTPDAPIGMATPGGATPLINTMMPGGQQSIAQAESAYNQAQMLNPYVEQALQRHLAGLGGISAPENQALREQAQREIRGQAKTATRNMRAFQGEAGVYGQTAANAYGRISNETRQALAQQETDLLARNVAEKGNRLASFSGAAQAAYGTQTDAANTALKNLLSARGDVANYQLGAEKTNADIGTANNQTALEYAKLNRDTAASNRDYTTNVNTYNLQAGERELSGRAGTFYGDQASQIALINQIVQEQLAKRAQDIANKGP